MPEIGATLREARVRRRIDISEIERVTKIRAKYLRALENEEWDLLPGPAYVKSFLRTYGDTLDLDGRMLVEEYKLRHERVSEAELQPIRPASAREGRRRAPRPLPRGALVGAVLVALLALLIVLGATAGDPAPDRAPEVAPAPAPDADRPPTAGEEPRRERTTTTRTTARPRRVRLQLVPTGPVWVCLQAGDRRLIPGQEISQRTRTFRARSFRVTLGNNNVRLRVNGRTVAVPASSDAIGYAITRNGRRTLSADERPTCGA